MRRAASTALLVLAFLLAPPSAAASESQVWDEDRIVRDDVVVPAGTTLVVRGASVTLANAALRIEPGGALRLESLPGRSAKITGEGDGSFVVAYGPTTLAGRPDAPAIVEGLGGLASVTSGSFAFTRGFAVSSAPFEADHAVFRNYTSGLLLQVADATLRNVTFESGRGLGLVTAGSHVFVDGLRLVGPGASAVITGSAKPATLANVSAFAVREALRVSKAQVEAQNVEVEIAERCVFVEGASTLALRAARCVDFTQAALEAVPAVKGVPRVDVAGLVASSRSHGASWIVRTQHGALRLADAALGPGAKVGVYGDAVVPAISNVTFRGLGEWNVRLDAPPDVVDPSAAALGETAGLGRLVATALATVRIEAPAALGIDEAIVHVLDAGNRTPVRAPIRSAAASVTFPVVTDRVDAAGLYVRPAYVVRVEASGLAGEAALDREGRAVVELAPAASPASLPGPGALALVAVLAALAGWRRARSSSLRATA